jgi:hypothetical protein
MITTVCLKMGAQRTGETLCEWIIGLPQRLGQVQQSVLTMNGSSIVTDLHSIIYRLFMLRKMKELRSGLTVWPSLRRCWIRRNMSKWTSLFHSVS